MRPAVEAEKLGIPGVVITTTGFTNIARTVAKAEGLAALRVGEYPGAVGVHEEALIERNVEQVLFPRIVEALTGPVPRSAGATPAATGAGRPASIAFEGTWDEIQAHFREREWADGHPFVPPTPGRIEAFLRHTDRDPDAAVAVLPPGNLTATPRTIAANGVMAGCPPQSMPVLIALVEALADNRYNLANIGSTWGVLPYVLVTGPAVQHLGMESGAHLISRGSNPAIGRALGLIVRNLAGFRLGRNYMGTFGYPVNFALAENQADSPWEPYHVEKGLGSGDSAVTVGATVTWGWPPAIYGTADKTAAQSALEFLALECTKKPCLARLAERGPRAFRNMITVLLAPPIARSLAQAGYSRQDIREYLYEHARVPYRELEFLLKYGHSEAFTIPDAIERGLYPEAYRVGPDERVRVLPSPDVVEIVVCGDPHRNRAMVLWGGYANPVTRKVIVAQPR